MEKALHIGIAGLGTVGVGVVQILKENAELLSQRAGRPVVVKAVSARDKKRDRGIDLAGIDWVDDPVALANHKDVDVIVELMGGAEGAAKDLVEAALKNGKSVVTANKALIARHGVALAKSAEASKLQLKCEAAVAGGIPVIKALKEGLAANRIQRVAGILNGTCNYILTTMEREDRGFPEVLKEAQDLGYAEADPSFDIDGVDAAHKLAILAAQAFGTKVDMDKVQIEGIRHVTSTDIAFAAELGLRIKLLGIAQRVEKGLELRVHPALVPADSSLAQVDGVLNAVEIISEPMGALFLKGPGAGRGATASAVVADIIDIAANRGGYLYNRPVSTLESLPVAAAKAHQGGFYLRLTVLDKPGVLAAVSAIFLEDQISIASLIQKTREPEKPVEIVLTTHDTTEASITKATTRIRKLEQVIEDPRFIRILAA